MNLLAPVRVCPGASPRSLQPSHLRGGPGRCLMRGGAILPVIRPVLITGNIPARGICRPVLDGGAGTAGEPPQDAAHCNDQEKPSEPVHHSTSFHFEADQSSAHPRTTLGFANRPSVIPRTVSPPAFSPYYVPFDCREDPEKAGVGGTAMEMVCMACGRKAHVSAEQARAGSYRCPGCHRQIRILTPVQAKALVRELRSVYMRHVKRGRMRAGGGTVRATRRVAARRKK